MSYTLIERRELTGVASSISFENIPQIFTDLVLFCSTRTSSAVLVADFFLSLNDNTSITTRNLLGGGSSTASQTPGNIAGYGNGSSSTSNTFGNNIMYFPNYSITGSKSYSVDSVMENNGTDSYQFIIAGAASP